MAPVPRARAAPWEAMWASRPVAQSCPAGSLGQRWHDLVAKSHGNTFRWNLCGIWMNLDERRKTVEEENCPTHPLKIPLKNLPLSGRSIRGFDGWSSARSRGPEYPWCYQHQWWESSIFHRAPVPKRTLFMASEWIYSMNFRIPHGNINQTSLAACYVGTFCWCCNSFSVSPSPGGTIHHLTDLCGLNILLLVTSTLQAYFDKNKWVRISSEEESLVSNLERFAFLGVQIISRLKLGRYCCNRLPAKRICA